MSETKGAITPPVPRLPLTLIAAPLGAHGNPRPKLSSKVSLSACAQPPQGGGGVRRVIARPLIVAAARDWLGTPYVHQACAKGQGTDCLGLIRGLYAEVCGHEPEAPPPYTPDWNERRAEDEPLLTAARRHLSQAKERPQPGQVLIFRIVTTGPAKHCGVVTTGEHFIHAYAGRAVIESWLSRWWIERIAGVFEFPGVEG